MPLAGCVLLRSACVQAAAAGHAADAAELIEVADSFLRLYCFRAATATRGAHGVAGKGRAAFGFPLSETLSAAELGAELGETSAAEQADGAALVGVLVPYAESLAKLEGGADADAACLSLCRAALLLLSGTPQHVYSLLGRLPMPDWERAPVAAGLLESVFRQLLGALNEPAPSDGLRYLEHVNAVRRAQRYANPVGQSSSWARRAHRRCLRLPAPPALLQWLRHSLVGSGQSAGAAQLAVLHFKHLVSTAYRCLCCRPWPL